MKIKNLNLKRGFTLLELLVVVVIIGILAAIALPQYKLAVEKTKSAEALAILQSMARAQQNYYLIHGSYATSFDGLDISLPGTLRNVVGGGEYITLPSGWTIVMTSKSYTHATNKSFTNTIVFHYINNVRSCHAKQNNKIANKVCESLGGKSPRDANDCSIGKCTVYTL